MNTRYLVILGTLLFSACVPIQMTVYVSDTPSTKVVYSMCSINKHIPIGVEVEAGSIRMFVSMTRKDGNQQLELRFDVPEGMTVRLQDDRARIETKDPGTAADAVFPLVSLVDHPFRNNSSAVPDIQARRLPIKAPLVGGWIAVGRASSPHHFWVGAIAQMANAKDFWVTLPRFTVNDGADALPKIHFRREHKIGWAAINC